jgi:hypothetical protein
MTRFITLHAVPPEPKQELPLVPHAPPAATAAFVWSRTDMLEEVWSVVQEVAALPGLAITPDPGGLCLAIRGGERLGYLRWDGRLYLPMGTDARDRLVAEDMASLDPDRPDADWVVFDVRAVTDVARAVWLLRLAYLFACENPSGNPCGTDIPGLRGRSG